MCYSEHEEEFLTAMAARFSFGGTTWLIFTQRFKERNADLNNANLADVLQRDLNSENPSHVLGDHLRRRIYPTLKRNGCNFDGTPPGQQWLRGMQWLRDTKYREWLESLASPLSPEENNHPPIDLEPIESIILKIRPNISDKIKDVCGQVKALFMSSPLDLVSIYTRVNILEKCIDQLCIEIQEGEEGCDDEQCLPKKKIKEYIPLFIALKKFSITSKDTDLLAYIQEQYSLDTASLELILRNGKALFLLDGLDEVREDEKSKLLQQLQDFIDRFFKNRFIITCRLGALDYNFENFTEVEIADFEDKQIDDFVKKWFANQPEQAGFLLFKLDKRENKPIRDLATSPLLLLLLCLVFEGSASFPENRSELYKEGLDVLLKTWDNKRGIERDQIYKNLSLSNKENLLSQIAFEYFAKGQILFKKGELNQSIGNFLRNLPSASSDPEELERDSEAVLKSIEAQHGLLIKQAREIYSFCHLTFQEYLAARYIVRNCDPNSIESPLLKELTKNLTESSWREIFLLTYEGLPRLDALLQLMKTKIDELLAQDPQLQEFLDWVGQKSQALADSIYLRTTRFIAEILLRQFTAGYWLAK